MWTVGIDLQHRKAGCNQYSMDTIFLEMPDQVNSIAQILCKSVAVPVYFRPSEQYGTEPHFPILSYYSPAWEMNGNIPFVGYILNACLESRVGNTDIVGFDGAVHARSVRIANGWRVLCSRLINVTTQRMNSQ